MSFTVLCLAGATKAALTPEISGLAGFFIHDTKSIANACAGFGILTRLAQC